MRRLVVAIMLMAIAAIILCTGCFVIMNRSSLCPVWTILTVRSADAAHARFMGSISEKVRAVETEDAYRRWETPEGQIWMPVGSDWLVSFLLAEQARGLYGNPVCRPGDIVLDCGAHVGMYTRHAVKDGARLVVAIEPAPENRECLKRNLAQEVASGKVIVVPKGVWEREEELFLRREAGNSGADSVTAGGQSGDLPVPLITIDRLTEDLGLPRVDVIKMDIEGAERKALTGARATLSRFRPRLAIATYHRSDDPEIISAIALRSNPGYSVKCGPCAHSPFADAWFGYKRLIPEVLFFE